MAAEAPWRIGQGGGDVDAISGATVTCAAITEAVNEVAVSFRQNLPRRRTGH
jgi:Na+-translocating ferredoxin:NAD+ oxidoreductase RnfG subunit